MPKASYLKDIVQYHDQVLDNTGLYLTIIDLQGVILYANAAICELVGVQKSFIEGNQVEYFLNANYAYKIKDKIEQVVRSRQSQNFETAISDKFFVVNLHPIIEPSGEVMAVQVISQDITAIKQNQLKLQKSEQLFRDLSENVPAVVYQWVEKFNGEFGFTFVSPKLKEYFNIEPSEMHRVIEYIHPDDRERWRLSIEESKRNRAPWVFEGRLINPDGRTIWWIGRSVISEVNEEGIVYNGTMTDITHRKESEMRLREQLETLRSLAFHNSHTVRRHSSNILGLCSLMEKELELHPENARVIELIYNEAQNLDKMILGIANLISGQEKKQ